MRSGGTRVSSICPYPLSVGLGCCRGSSLLYCSAVPLVVCHVNSSQRGTVSALLFRSALFFFPPRVPNLCPSRFSASQRTPKLCPPVDPSQCRANSGEERIPLVCVSDPLYHNGRVSPWVPLPSHSFHCQSWEE